MSSTLLSGIAGSPQGCIDQTLGERISDRFPRSMSSSDDQSNALILHLVLSLCAILLIFVRHSLFAIEFSPDDTSMPVQ